MYVALSRCINLENIVVVSQTELTRVFNSKTVRQYKRVLQYIDDPTQVLPMDILTTDGDGFYLDDSSSINGCITRKNVAICTKNGQHRDRYITENERVFDNLINIDHETGYEHAQKHQVIYTAPLWIFNGRITDFKTFIRRNGGSFEGLVDYETLDSGHMEF